MPKKIRELKQILRRVEFEQMPGRGKGSHSMWQHRRHPELIVDLSGNDGRDAQRYHEKDVEEALADVRRLDEENS